MVSATPYMSWRMSTSIVNAGETLQWITSRVRPFRAADLADAFEIDWRTAARWLYSAEIVGWVRRERVHNSKTLYHPLVRIEERS